MKIFWLTSPNIQATDKQLTSDIASIRYRVLQPASYLAKIGVDISLHTSPMSLLSELGPQLNQIKKDCTVIFSKSLDLNGKLIIDFLK